jgi:hypothetical protein
MGINKDGNLSSEATELRRHAEERLRAKTEKLQPSRTREATQRLVHELEVHQIELEMQNAELRQVRDELERSLEKYSDLFDFAPVGYFTLDDEGAIRNVNLAGASLIGGLRSRLIGRRFKLFVAAADRPTLTEFLHKVLTCRIKESCEVALIKKGKLPLIVQIEAMATASGQECRFALIDITERKKSEEALRFSHKELDELVRARTGELAATVDTLREEYLERLQAVEALRENEKMFHQQSRLAAMGEMINNIAHQWRQPLNELALLIQQMQIFYNSGSLSKEELDSCMIKAMSSIKQLSQTIDDFRNFFKPDKEQVSFKIHDVIAKTVSLVEDSFKNQQIGIDFNVSENPALTGFPNEYSQVLLNILSNARDALQENRPDGGKIKISIGKEKERAVVTITDNAGGIPEEIIGRIFEPYFTTKGPNKGTGVGLFMSKTIIEKNMNGSLTVRNTDEGAEFRIEV